MNALFRFSLALILVPSFVTAQLVMPGDYPDPSVTKVGNAYWATATSSNWGPLFPLLRSDDLVHWENQGFVFETLPNWADYYFWAPEISYENGKVFIYYSAHKKNGNLCLGVASADKPEGPYTDHGPVMCQDVGSIDGFPMRDENGTLHLIWKEDGNSVGKPTPIWISEMNEERTALVGEKRELFRNDAPWEANLVEGVAMIRHGGYFYAFYAAAGCCGRGCTYATGVARSRNLLGPWEKYDQNPLLVSDEQWTCPGHGTAIEKDGRFYFLYHAYERKGNVFTGRQGLLKEFRFTPDNWITFVEAQTAPDISAEAVVREEFTGNEVSHRWQWSVFHRPDFTQQNGALELKASTGRAVAFLGQRTYRPDYTVQTTVDIRKSTAEAGVAAIGDDDNLVGVSVHDNVIRVWKREKGNTTILEERKATLKGTVVLQMTVRNGKDLVFSYKVRDRFLPVHESPVDGGFLPPWDRAVRAGLTSKGQNGHKAVFEDFILYH